MPKIYDGEKTASSTNVAGKSGLPVCKKLKLDPCLSPCTSINSKWIQDLNIRPETLKLIQEGEGNTLEQVLSRMWKKRNPNPLLVGMQAGATTLEKHLETS
jgi:hypothetical protein